MALEKKRDIFTAMMNPAYEDWAKSATPYFRENYGLNGNMALNAARLYVALWGAGLSPRPTSGFRDPGKQEQMRAAWDRGQRAGLRARPADPKTSKHCQTTWMGGPASQALDMTSTNEVKAAQVVVGEVIRK